MKLKHVGSFFIVVAMVAFAGHLYAIGATFLILIALLYGALFFLMLDMFELYSRLPTAWQGIPETLEVAKASWWLNRGVTFGAASGLYRILQCYGSLFEVRVDERAIDAFERKYWDRRAFDHPMTSKQRALCYFMISRDHNPERLPEIVNAIQVRKKVGGKEVKGKTSMFLQMVLN